MPGEWKKAKRLQLTKSVLPLNKMAKDLTKKESLFVNEYLRVQNATQAAKVAGYREKTAGQAGCRLLKSPKIKSEIERRTKGVFKKVEDAADQALEKLAVTSGNIIDSLAEMGLAHRAVAKFLKVSTGGDLYYDFTGATEQDLLAIQPMISELVTESYAEGRGENKRDVIRTKVKFVERKGVLELLGKWKRLKMWSENTEHTHLVFSESMTRQELEEYANTGVLPARLQSQLPAGPQVIDGQ